MGRGLLGFMDLSTYKKKNFPLDSMSFSQKFSDCQFFYRFLTNERKKKKKRFLRTEQAHETLDPWVTCRMASLLFNTKHLRCRLSVLGEYGKQ